MKVLVIAANIVWLFSPPMLAIWALRECRRKRDDTRSRLELPLALGTVLLADWALFVYFIIHSATPYGMYFRTSSSTTVLFLLSVLAAVVAFSAGLGRWQLVSASVLIVTLWVCIGYAPAHYLRRVDFGSVTVDDRAVSAFVYLGHPTDMEAEAFALVRLENGGDYLFNFDSEKVRPASDSEYVRVPGGIWYLRPMQGGAFTEPLPHQRMNQFRVRSTDGHVIVVQF